MLCSNVQKIYSFIIQKKKKGLHGELVREVKEKRTIF